MDMLGYVVLVLYSLLGLVYGYYSVRWSRRLKECRQGLGRVVQEIQDLRDTLRDRTEAHVLADGDVDSMLTYESLRSAVAGLRVLEGAHEAVRHGGGRVK